VKYLLAFLLLLLACETPRPQQPQVVCNKDAVCCYKANKNSSVCIRYEKQKKIDSTFIYFQFKQ